MSELFGLADRDSAGIMMIYAGDPIPNPLPQGFSQVVIVARGSPQSAATNELPSLASDAMPPRTARELAIEANELHQRCYNRYSRGDFPPWANKEFLRLYCQSANSLKEMLSEIEMGRNGRPNTPRKNCLSLITDAYKAGTWPGDFTEKQWADKWAVDLRTYQRAKHDFQELLAERMIPKPL